MASIWKKLQEKYILSIRNQDRFFESSKLSVSGFELLSILLLGLLLTIFISFLLFRYTSLNVFLTSSENKKMKVVELNERADSLEIRLQQQGKYVENIQRILKGDPIELNQPFAIDSQKLAKLKISDPTAEELSLRERINHRDQLEVTKSSSTNQYFLAPIEGVVSSEFSPKNNHFGIDIVAPKNTAIKAIDNGRVLYSSWSAQDGHSLIILHENNFVSIYKHAEKLLKEVNESIQRGEAVAIIGDSGDNTTGYHLHFELWKNSSPINPSEYIKFEI